MPSTPWHSPRLGRASLFLGALALVLVVPGAAAHLACDHTDEGGRDHHQCAVCRHLDDGTPLLATMSFITAPALVADLAEVPVDGADSLFVPPARGRSPPAHVSVS